MRVVLFAGGSGSASIARAFIDEGVELTIVVNCYDDGLSTGALRKAIPGMLGPSDIRKNVARHCAVPPFVLNQRINTSAIVGPSTLPGDFSVYEAAILDYLGSRNLNIEQCAVGNLLFAGCYVSEGKRDFNTTIRLFSAACGCYCRVLNVTEGRNAYLWARRSDGSFHNEYQISTYVSPFQIEELILSSSPIQVRSVVPDINPEVAQALREADLIMYGPGTQHSSLLPSYMTKGVAEAIMCSSAFKVYVANADRDKDTPVETVRGLMDKFTKAMRRGAIEVDWSELVNLSIVPKDGLPHGDLSGMGPVEYSHLWASGGRHQGLNVVSHVLSTLPHHKPRLASL